ncbi:PLP-dependent aminotransferase family protein [Thalassolituus maritimus]|uniref:PLP-dependent aminotransferase family protein n=1 Tax=Thalassolituus maritimus TaxID=484498 RepID=A0ABP9ZWX5_9GAMM
MDTSDLQRWVRLLQNTSGKPAYRAIADIIADDINSGRLQPRDRLPPLRDLADASGLNYTTTVRAYAEARKRGLIESHPGSGSYIKGKPAQLKPSVGSYEMTMNLMIEPAIPTLVEEIKDSAMTVIAQMDTYNLLRYQAFGGSQNNREMALSWLRRRLPDARYEQTLICPGIHSTLVGLMSALITPGKVLCVESLVYPGIKAIAAQLGMELYPIERDSDGMLVRPFEDACKEGKVGALYLNPTIQNPTTVTMSRSRREVLADVALRYSIPIIEDDAYTMLADNPPPAFASLAPELTYYITGTSKCFGPGVRSAFLHTPGKRQTQRVLAALRATSVMSSPFTDCVVSQWIRDGVADNMIKAVRRESSARLEIAREQLDTHNIIAADGAFHLWLKLPKQSEWSPVELAAHLRSMRVSAVASAAFSTDNNPPNAIRLCYGGPITRDEWRQRIIQAADVIEHPYLVHTNTH